ncbi:MAG TPA: carboxyl transferase domain-containing protein [Nevskiaceae bacterium]|nr:carboxyl transferase domain-containing protein [Nevskiaceae bacterium]
MSDSDLPRDALAQLEARKERAREMGGADKIERQHARGALTARERIARLLDADSFFELGQLNHSDVPGMEARTAADGKIAGYGRIDGRSVAVAADDVTVLAGSGGRIGGRKSHRILELAVEKGYPLINLGEAGGARIPDILGSDGLSSMTIGMDAAQRCRRVPMVAAIFGECFGSASWYAALADFVVQVKGSCMAVSGPRVLEMATGEKSSNDELGGWELHARVTGLADRAAEDEAHALAIVREFLSYLPSSEAQLPPVYQGDDEAAARQSRLDTFLPDSPRHGYDMHEIIHTLADHRHFFPVKPEFDRSVITGFMRVDGRSVGVIASNPRHAAGAMGPDGCDKCASFIALCDSFHVPLLFLHDTPGFFVGKAAEQKRMPGKIINFIEALSLATVPIVSIVVRKSYGMAYGNMAGSGMGADFVYAWPTADIGFMAPEVAANVVGGPKIKSAPDPKAAMDQVIAEIRESTAPWRAAGLHYLDDVIRPSDTRAVLIRSMELARGNNGGRSQRRLANWPTSF